MKRAENDTLHRSPCCRDFTKETKRKKEASFVDVPRSDSPLFRKSIIVAPPKRKMKC